MGKRGGGGGVEFFDNSGCNTAPKPVLNVRDEEALSQSKSLLN